MVHGYTHPFELQMILAARRCGARTLMRGEFTDSPRPGRSWIKGVLRRLFLRWLYRHVDAFCCLGKNGRDHLLSYGIADSRLSSSPYAVDNEVFEQQRLQFPRAAMRTALGIERDCLAVLFSGKMIPRKAPGLLVEAIRRLGMGDTRSIHLIMVGEGPLRSEVESLARSVLGNRLNMPGFVNQSQLGRYFAAADVLVLPSHFETWGLVVNEAMLFGLPAIVSSNVGCHADLVVPGKTGLVFPAGDATGLATCLRRCLCRGDELVRMGRGAKAHIAKYSIEASARGILSAIFGRSSPVGKTCCILPPHPTRSHTNLTRQF
jgi:glycosyltransferase involved in cell wall biosynthesis